MIRALALAAALLGSAATANQSCFVRDYSADHLAKNPNQIVKTMWIGFQGDALEPLYAGQWADVTVEFTNYGFPLIERLYCDGPRGGKVTCRVECDGGSFTAEWRNSDTIVIRTSGFYVGSNCDGSVNRVVKDIGARSTAFRLNRARPEQCPHLD